jgi:ABC-type glycerol-3-phosphate transport system permease component
MATAERTVLHTLHRKSWKVLLAEFSRQFIVYALLLILGTAILLPFLWTISSSLKPYGAGIKFPPQFIPETFMWENYPKVFETIPFTTFFRNSVFVTGLAVIGELLSASMVAYAFARLRFPGNKILFMVVLATMMIPFPVTMVPTFILFKLINMVGTYLPLVLPPFFGPAFSIFLLRQFFLTINLELDEAAKVDGANELMIYWRIILPLARPALATIAIFSFMANWNDFMGPLIYLSDQRLYPLSLGLYALNVQAGGNYGMMMAAAFLMTLPVVLVFFFAQKYFIQGITLTGMKS